MTFIPSNFKKSWDAAYPVVKNATFCGLLGASACLIANKVGITILAANPWSGLVFCSSCIVTGSILYRKVRKFYKETFQSFRLSRPSRLQNLKYSALIIACTVTTIALPKFAISCLAPHLAITTTAGILTLASAMSIKYIMDKSLTKLGQTGIFSSNKAKTLA